MPLSKRTLRILGWLGIFVLMLVYLTLAACGGTPTSAPTATTLPTNPPPTPSSTATLTPSPTNTATATPLPTLSPLVFPTPPAGGLPLVVPSNAERSGWFSSRDLTPHWRDRNLATGFSQGQTFVSVIQFDLNNVTFGSKVLFAVLELTGRDASTLGTAGEWSVDLIDSSTLLGDAPSFNSIQQTRSLTTIGNAMPAQTLGTGIKKRLVFQPAQYNLLEKQIDQGRIAIRVRGPSSGSDSVFGWDGGPGPAEPTLYLVVMPAPLVVVTNTPTPVDIFAAATRVVQQTAQARAIGTPTPPSRNVITATPAQAGGDYVIYTAVPTASNSRDATATALYATAVAVTTGTFTPIPPNWVTETPRPLLIPLKNLTPVPSPTPTLVVPTTLQYAAMPLPAGLFNKIMFLEGSREKPNVWIMDPDGANVQLVTDRRVYEIARARDTIGSNTYSIYHAYNALDAGGKLQIWAQDMNYPYGLPFQLSYLRGNSFAFAPAWSPDGTLVAFTSSETGKQEIFIHNFNPERKNLYWKQLTQSSNDITRNWNQFPSWSPDGTKIVYSSDQGHSGLFSEIWIMDADGNNPYSIGNGSWDTWQPVWVKWKQ